MIHCISHCSGLAQLQRQRAGLAGVWVGGGISLFENFSPAVLSIRDSHRVLLGSVSTRPSICPSGENKGAKDQRGIEPRWHRGRNISLALLL